MTIENKLKRILSINFNVEEKKLKRFFLSNKNFYDLLNWDSLNIVKFFLLIEKEFKTKINAQNFNKLTSFKKLLHYFKKNKIY